MQAMSEGSKEQMKKIYICGKITGEKDYRAKFLAEENRLFSLGYDPVNPTVMVRGNTPWEQAMRIVLWQCLGAMVSPCCLTGKIQKAQRLKPLLQLMSELKCALARNGDKNNFLFNRVVRKLQFSEQLPYKTAKYAVFCRTCETTNRVVEQVQLTRK